MQKAMPLWCRCTIEAGIGCVGIFIDVRVVVLRIKRSLPHRFHRLVQLSIRSESVIQFSAIVDHRILIVTVLHQFCQFHFGFVLLVLLESRKVCAAPRDRTNFDDLSGGESAGRGSRRWWWQGWLTFLKELLHLGVQHAFERGDLELKVLELHSRRAASWALEFLQIRCGEAMVMAVLRQASRGLGSDCSLHFPRSSNGLKVDLGSETQLASQQLIRARHNHQTISRTQYEKRLRERNEGCGLRPAGLPCASRLESLHGFARPLHLRPPSASIMGPS